MTEEILKWDLYEISSPTSILNGVKLRGRIRKFGLLNNLNILAENTTDEEGKVRFAILENTDPSPIINKIKQMMPDSQITQIQQSLPNPILSKMRANLESRYEI